MNKRLKEYIIQKAIETWEENDRLRKAILEGKKIKIVFLEEEVSDK